MARERVVPAGHEHEVGIDEFFFSATDAAGVIELANSTFVRLSHYPHGELVGAPHNIVRHPDMPGGAFKLVWDQLRAGRPACAYVKNLAADGGTYWVFATLLPVGDKLLSVGKRALVGDLLDASDRLYAQVRPVEAAAREDGAGRDEAATIGLALLAEGLAGIGLRGADDLALAALPAEMAAHAKVTAGLPRRPGATGPLAELLTTTHDVDAQTARLAAALDEYADLVRALEASYADAVPVANRLQRVADASAEGCALDAVVAAAEGEAARMVEAARLAGAGVSGGHVETTGPAILDVGARICAHAQCAGERLRALGGRLADLAWLVRWLRMRIALVRLHTTMVSTFAAELIDGGDEGDSEASMALLCRALAEGVDELATTYAAVRVATAQVPGDVEDAVRLGDRILRLAGKWRAEVRALRVEDAAAQQLGVLDDLGRQGFDELRRFHDVAARCRLLADPFDPARLTASVAAMRDGLAAYGAGAAA